MADMSPDERAELERLLREAVAAGGTAAGGNRWPGRGRWLGACALLLVAAVLGSLAVVAVYLRSEVLDTNTYVQTVARLGEDPAVRSAVAARLTDEIITRSDVAGLANQLAQRLEAQGAPARLSDLVGPLVSGVSSFLNGKIDSLMTTERFEVAWQNINRVAHQALVTTLTGGQNQLLTSKGDTVTIDLGELLSLVKQQLVSEGLTIFGRIPDVSIQYTLVQSDQLPKIRTYTKLLNTAGTWLPWVALALLLAGILVAPNRRRGIILGCVLLGVFAALTLAAVTIGRTYYLDNLPSSIRSPDAAAAVINTMLRFLIAALQTLLVVMAVFIVGAFLAGPSRVAVGFRRLVNLGVDAGAEALRKAGRWVTATGRVLAAAYRPIQIGLVLLAVAGFILADRPGVSAVLWAAAAVLLLLVVLEVFVRAWTRAPSGMPAPG